jgi:hypothetical protein
MVNERFRIRVYISRLPQVRVSVVEDQMKYFIKTEAGLAIESLCNSERYLALEIESPPPAAGCPVQSVPCWPDSSARFRRFKEPIGVER